MPRIAPIDPATATGYAKEVFEGPLKGKTFNIFKSMATSRAVLEMYLSASGALNHATLSAREREMIQLAIGQANNCGYCSAAHTAISHGMGMADAQIIEARKGAMVDSKLNALVKFALNIHEKRGTVSDNDVQQFLAAGYTQAQIGEVVACYSLAIFTNYFNHVNDTPLDFPPASAI
jgi:uncharacterized peroxidase-related enzyme